MVTETNKHQTMYTTTDSYSFAVASVLHLILKKRIQICTSDKIKLNNQLKPQAIQDWFLTVVISITG